MTSRRQAWYRQVSLIIVCAVATSFVPVELCAADDEAAPATAEQRVEPSTAPSPDQSADALPADQQDFVLFGPLRPLSLRVHLTVDKIPFRQYWRARIDDTFADLDADHDGLITPAQMAKLVAAVGGPAAPTGDDAAKSSPSKKEDTKDGDKVADATTADKPSVDDAAKPKDEQNAAATITLSAAAAEVARVAPPIVVRDEPAVSGTAIFSILDADGDRRLSHDELSGAEQLLRRRDFNDDEVITADELFEDPRARAVDAVAGPRAASATGPVLPLSDGADPAAPPQAAANEDPLVAALKTHYDRNGDGRLSAGGLAPELYLDTKSREQLQLDPGGSCTPEALAKLCRQQIDIELHLGIGSGSAVARWSTAPTAEGEFKIRRRLSGVVKIEGRGVDLELSRNNRNPTREADQGYSFSNYDKDSNGYLDEAECKSLPAVAGTFTVLDADHDGKVMPAEFSQYLQRKARAASGRLLVRVLDRGQDLFDLLDTMPDSQLSVREILAAPQLLVTADRNGDGYLAGEEIAERVDVELGRAAAEIADRLSAPGRLVPRSRREADQPAGPDWFIAMDRNQDGDLSRREFLGTSAAFTAFDTDGNGLIDADEAAAAR